MLARHGAVHLGCLIESFVHFLHRNITTFLMLHTMPKHMLRGVPLAIFTVGAEVRVDDVSRSQPVTRPAGPRNG